jgi:hypothetical protein
VHNIGTDFALGALDELFDLGAVGIDHRRPRHAGRRVRSRGATLDVVLDGVVVAASQPGRAPIGAHEVVGLQNLHDLSGRLDLDPSWSAALQHRRRTRRDHPCTTTVTSTMNNTGEF